jgi:hypothetical protein
MVDSTIRFNLINNKSFHNKLENKIPNGPVDASNSVFDGLSLDLNGKCYYPLFLREPFSFKDFDFCELIDPDHMQQLKDKKAIPLVCMLSELWPLFNPDPASRFSTNPYFNIINHLKDNGIGEEDVVWLTCDKYIRKDPRIKAKFIHFDFFLEQQKVVENNFLPLQEIKHKFISMAQGVARHHRYAMTYQLYNDDLFKHGAISCTNYKNFSYHIKTETTDEYINRLENYNEQTFEEFKNLLPLTIDSKSTQIEVPDWGSNPDPINLHQDGRDESHLFENVFLNLVNETHHPDPTVFITEKTYRSINYCRPFVINGDKGSLQYLKEMGFRTFDKFWDESYDMDDDHTKIIKISKIVEYVCGLDIQELQTLYKEMLPTLEHNYRVLKNYKQWSKLN